MVNLNKLAKEVTDDEGLKVNLPIGQVKEVIRITFLKLQKLTQEELFETVKRQK